MVLAGAGMGVVPLSVHGMTLTLSFSYISSEVFSKLSGIDRFFAIGSIAQPIFLVGCYVACMCPLLMRIPEPPSAPHSWCQKAIRFLFSPSFGLRLQWFE